jgi:hypothetical protein
MQVFEYAGIDKWSEREEPSRAGSDRNARILLSSTVTV